MNPPETESPPPLRMLIEQARSPKVGRAQVDALLLGLAQPLRPGEQAHARAELLRLILGDKRLRSFSGSKGRRVHAAAAQAMAALGQPYAGELSPEDLAELRAARLREERAHESSSEGPVLRHVVGRTLLIAACAVELYALLRWEMPFGLMMLTLLTTLAPARFATSTQVVANRVLHFVVLGLALLPCPHMTMMAVAFFVLSDSKPTTTSYMLLLVPWALAAARVVAVGCLYTRPRERPQGSPSGA